MRLTRKLKELFALSRPKSSIYVSLESLCNEHTVKEMKELSRGDKKNLESLVRTHRDFIDEIKVLLKSGLMTDGIPKMLIERLLSILCQGTMGLADCDSQVTKVLSKNLDLFALDDLMVMIKRIEELLKKKEGEIRLLLLQDSEAKSESSRSSLKDKLFNIKSPETLRLSTLQKSEKKIESVLITLEKLYLVRSKEIITRCNGDALECHLSYFISTVCRFRNKIEKAVQEVIKLLEDKCLGYLEVSESLLFESAEDLIAQMNKDKASRRGTFEERVRSISINLANVTNKLSTFSRGSYEEKKRRSSIKLMQEELESYSYTIMQISEQYSNDITRARSNLEIIKKHFLRSKLVSKDRKSIADNEISVISRESILFSPTAKSLSKPSVSSITKLVRMKAQPIFSSGVLGELKGVVHKRKKA